jgi:hypothetical protein
LSSRLHINLQGDFHLSQFVPCRMGPPMADCPC